MKNPITNLEELNKKILNHLKPHALDGHISREDFFEIVDNFYNQSGLTPEEADYMNIEIQLNNLNCIVYEKFLSFDEFELNKV